LRECIDEGICDVCAILGPTYRPIMMAFVIEGLLS